MFSMNELEIDITYKGEGLRPFLLFFFRGCMNGGYIFKKRATRCS